MIQPIYLIHLTLTKDNNKFQSGVTIDKMLHSTFLISAAFAAFLPIAHSMAISEMSSSKASKDPYQVVWTTPSADASGSMPMGNGEVGINLWVEKNGDLFFYISRSDSLSEISRLVKVGGVRVSISPNPLKDGAPFKQALLLKDGVCRVEMGEGAKKVVLKVFVDADSPVIYCVGSSAAPITVNATALCWRTERREITGGEQNSAWTMQGAPFPLIESADVFPAEVGDAVVWYHRDEKALETAFPSTLKVQSLDSLSGKVHDPLLDRTFGGWMVGTGFKAAAGHAIETSRSIKSFSLRVAAPCSQTPTAKDWMETAKKIADGSGDYRVAMNRTSAWWKAYWERSWVIVNHAPSQIEVPGAGHSLRIGYDSNGQNKFPGEVARVAVYDRALTPVEIGEIAASGKDDKTPIIKGVLLEGDGSPREIANNRLNFSSGFTLDAWIKPDGVGVGRIFDKLTAGQQDGFLFDIYPQNNLRLIVGALQLQSPTDDLSAGQWHNAAATFSAESGVASLYLDGKLAAKSSAAATASSITDGYILQDYVQACGGRGNLPIKFNGGIFTVEPKASGKPYNPDWRAWGECYWWQNTRHMYHPMLASGDYDMMSPLFRLYEDVRPLCEARTELYHHAQGCYFPETMTAWGTYSNSDYGWNRTGHEPKDVLSPWWQYAWNQGPELVALMLDRWDYTEDSTFLQKQLLPMAVSVLKYFDTRFKKDADGKIVLDPDQAVETYWSGVINDTPAVAGLNDITTRLCELPQNLTTPKERQFFMHMRQACPPVATEEAMVDGRSVRIIAPAEKYEKHLTNCENPELYAIWPFRLYGVGRPGLEMARDTYAHRINHLDVGWGYDGNCAALLGMRDEAARILKIKCVNSNPAYRWPATWGPNFDWLPDQNHGGNLLETTQLMLMQSVGRKILLLPAWPQDWDVVFKLHAPFKTTVECSYRHGKIVDLRVTPSSRTKDVVDMSHRSNL
jgi:hypothetical protein